MQATPWEWSQPRTPTLGQKVLTLATDWTSSVIQVLKIPGEIAEGLFAPGVVKALDQADKAVSQIAARYAADLTISPLDDPIEFTGFDIVPPPATSKSGDGPVFFEGVDMMLSIEHNDKGQQPITLEKIDLIVTAVPGADPYFAYRRDGSKAFGAGFVEPMRFMVVLTADGPRRARRQITSADGKDTMLVAQSPNLLDTRPASIYEFAPKERQKLKITLSALDEGYYEAYLRFFYRVAARELRQQNRGPIRLYTNGA